MIRRLIQIASLGTFLALLAAGVFALPGAFALDYVLGLDPALAAVTAAGSRTAMAAFLPALVVVALAPILGRAFCGYVCPMGTTLDGAEKVLRAPSGDAAVSSPAWRALKYLVLAFLLGAAAAGVSYAYWGAPFSLITRFYGLIVYPAVSYLVEAGLALIGPVAERFDWNAILFAEVQTPRFDTQLFLMALFAGIVGAAWLAPRFWCRYVCPAGALLALFARKPLLRRRVSEACGGCGQCVEACPMGAIPVSDPAVTHHEECLLCRTCQDVCPKTAVVFTGWKSEAAAPAPFSPGRRQMVLSGAAGLGAATLGLIPLSGAAGRDAEAGVGTGAFVRPPGAVPEGDFLALCTRCGACIAACPTNALQPAWLKAGFTGLFSPALTPRRGPCDPECARCGAICPTGSLRALAGEERLWAKTGTAVIVQEECIAWDADEKCMVCDEVCPFDAVVFEEEPGHPVTVPRVVSENCAGCGYCENACPTVGRSAIRVTVEGAIRLAEGSLEAEGRRRGLDIALDTERSYPSGLPETEATAGPAPGFSN